MVGRLFRRAFGRRTLLTLLTALGSGAALAAEVGVRIHLLFAERRVGRALELTRNERIFLGHHVVVGARREFWGDAAAPAELVEVALADANEYFVRQARKVLAERGLAGVRISGESLTKLRSVLTSEADPLRRLRALWILQSTNLLDDALLAALDR